MKTFLFFLLSIFLPFIAKAAEVPNLGGQDIIDILNNIGNWIFIIGLVLVPVMAIIGAVFFLTGGDDPNKIATGRKILLWAGVGLVLILLARGVFAVLKSILGA